MISEATTRAWVVTTKPIAPSARQFFSGQCDGVSKFYTDWRNAIPLTFSEAKRVASELDGLFALRGDNFEVVWLGDVAKFRPTFNLDKRQHYIRIV